jgi:hypothetical protein
MKFNPQDWNSKFRKIPFFINHQTRIKMKRSLENVKFESGTTLKRRKSETCQNPVENILRIINAMFLDCDYDGISKLLTQDSDHNDERIAFNEYLKNIYPFPNTLNENFNLEDISEWAENYVNLISDNDLEDFFYLFVFYADTVDDNVFKLGGLGIQNGIYNKIIERLYGINGDIYIACQVVLFSSCIDFRMHAIKSLSEMGKIDCLELFLNARVPITYRLME